jgi:hypothetical protein
MFIKVTPSKAQASLRNLARGREPQIPVGILADYLLHHGSLSLSTSNAPKDDFVHFAEHLHALNDPRPEQTTDLKAREESDARA